MKTLCGIAVVGLVLLVTVVPCVGAGGEPKWMDGNALLRLCREALSWIDERNVVRTQSVGAAYCLGFITGMLDMNDRYRVHFKRQGISESNIIICPPWSDTIAISAEQGARIVVRYLETHPELLHHPGMVLAQWALREAFPCQAPAR